MQIAKLFARIGLKTDEDKVKSFNKNLGFAKTALIGIAGTAATASAAIIKFSKDAMAGAVVLRQFEAETGASAQELQRWQAVAEQTGQSADSVSAAIKAITSNQEKIRLGEGNISGYQLLGIDPRQDPFDILEQLREKTDGLSAGMKRNVLAQMGISASMIQTLELSREQFDAMASRAFIIPPAAIDTLTRSKAMMDQAARGIQYLKTQIVVGLAPGIEDLTKKLIEFIKRNEQGFIRGFQKAFQVLTRFITAIGNAVIMIDKGVSGTIGWANALKILLGVMLALNASFWASPIGLIIAGILLLIAVLDDLYVYSKGGKSLFGEMMERFPGLEGGLKEMIDGFMNLAAAVKAIWTGDFTGGIQELIDSWGTWGDILEGIVGWLRDIKDLIAETKVGRQEGETTAGRQRTQFEAAQEQGLGLLFRDPGLWLQNLGSVLSGGGSIVNNNNVDINIDGSGSPEATADATRRELQRALNSTSGQRGRNE